MRKISSSLAPKPPAPPAPPSPPVAPVAFPINLPGETMATRPQRSLFKDMFGTDHSILALALDSNWSSHEQRELAMQVLSGHKSISKLTPSEHDVLDGIVHSYNDSSGGGARAYDSVQTGSERLSVSGDDRERGENLQSGSEDGVQDRPAADGGDGPDFNDAYSWTK